MRVRRRTAKGTGKRETALAIVFALLTAIGSALFSPARAESVIYINYRDAWSFAKESCREVWVLKQPERRDACASWEVIFDEFMTRLQTQFAINPGCHGISFPKTSPDSSWNLDVQFSPGQELANWILLGPRPDYVVFKGAGRPEKIAQELCSAANGRGGRIQR
jgi:hypothetical protein